MPHRTANPTPAPNRGYTYAGRVDARSAGRTLIDYLTQRYPHGSAVEWRERIAAGRVAVELTVPAGADPRDGAVDLAVGTTLFAPRQRARFLVLTERSPCIKTIIGRFASSSITRVLMTQCSSRPSARDEPCVPLRAS